MQTCIGKEVHYDILSLYAITLMFSFEIKRNADFHLYVGRKKKAVYYFCAKKNKFKGGSRVSLRQQENFKSSSMFIWLFRVADD